MVGTMAKEVRFGDFVSEIGVHEQTISYNYLTPKLLRDKEGHEIPYRPSALKLRSIDV